MRWMQQEHIGAVRRMQQYLDAHPTEEVDVRGLSRLVGYSERHCERLFREYTGKSLQEYARLLTLTEAAKSLAGEQCSVLEAALKSRYESHEGFTRAFSNAFGVTPSRYRKGGVPIPYFISFPARILPEDMEAEPMNTPVVTATFVQKPARTLCYLPAKQATEYMGYCDEVGCEWHGLLKSIPEKLDEPALYTDSTLFPGVCAAGVELPEDYSGSLPEGYTAAKLPAGMVLEFSTAPYEDEAAFCNYIEAVFAACEGYDVKRHGYRYGQGIVPVANFGADAPVGARITVPVEKL